MLSFLSPFLPSKSRRGGTRVETLSKIYRRLIGSCHISLGRLRYIAIYRIQYIGTGCTWHLALTWKNFSKVVNTSEHPQEHRPDSHPPNLSLILSTLNPVPQVSCWNPTRILLYIEFITSMILWNKAGV